MSARVPSERPIASTSTSSGRDRVRGVQRRRLAVLLRVVRREHLARARESVRHHDRRGRIRALEVGRARVVEELVHQEAVGDHELHGLVVAELRDLVADQLSPAVVGDAAEVDPVRAGCLHALHEAEVVGSGRLRPPARPAHDAEPEVPGGLRESVGDRLAVLGSVVEHAGLRRAERGHRLGAGDALGDVGGNEPGVRARAGRVVDAGLALRVVRRFAGQPVVRVGRADHRQRLLVERLAASAWRSRS